jgi:hypothetical protein
MNNGGHPHREGLSLGLISSGRTDQGRRHYQVGKRRHEPGNEKNDGGRQDDCEHQGKDIEAVGRAGHPRLTPFDRSQSQMHPVEMPASNPSGAPLDFRLSTPAGECKTPGHFSGTAGASPALPYSPLYGPRVVGCHGVTGERGWAMVATRANFSAGGTPWERADLFFLCDALSRGMSIQDLAGFLNRSVDEVRQQAASHCHDSISSSDGSASKRHRRSMENKSAFSAGSPVLRAKRRASAARFRHSDLS